MQKNDECPAAPGDEGVVRDVSGIFRHACLLRETSMLRPDRTSSGFRHPNGFHLPAGVRQWSKPGRDAGYSGASATDFHRLPFPVRRKRNKPCVRSQQKNACDFSIPFPRIVGGGAGLEGDAAE